MKKTLDQKLGELHSLGDKLFVYVHASRSKIQDSYGNYIFSLKDENPLYCDPSATIDGKVVLYQQTIVHQIDQKIETFESKIRDYFTSDPQFVKDLQIEIKEVIKQLDAVGGNMHQLWFEADPTYFDPNSTSEKKPFRLNKILYHTHSILSILINYPSLQGKKYVD